MTGNTPASDLRYEQAEYEERMKNDVREGCVVRPLHERWNEEVGRVCLKIVGDGYLEKD